MPLPLVDRGLTEAVLAETMVRTWARVTGATGAHLRQYQSRPVEFVTDELGEFVWSKQREIAHAVRDHRRVAVHSAHQTGKSWLAARLVSWWLACHEFGDAFVVTTAPTGPQVRAILWREIARAHRAGNLPGRLNQTEWFMVATGLRYTSPRHHEEMVAFGRKPSDYDPSAFQGIHARHVLVVVDEACGVPEVIFNSAGSLVANEHSRILAIGNPDDPGSHFAKICGPGSAWHVIHVDGLMTPNFTGEEIPERLRDLLISPVYVEDSKQEWGEDSPLYLSKVRGLFSSDRPDGVIPLSLIRKCQAERAWEPANLLPVELGVDVGAGGDETVIRERRGVKVGRTWRTRTKDPMAACGTIVQAIETTGATRVKVDVIGVGWGIAGRLEELGREGRHKAAIGRVNVGEASTQPKRFPRLRDELWWTFRELLQQSALDLAGLDDTTIAQLIAPTWLPDSAGRIHVEPKADTRKRIGRSPDDADALLLSVCQARRGGFVV